jgi:hypothetical protein
MDTPNSLNQPPEAAIGPDIPNGYSAPVARLAALAMHLGTRGLDVDVTREALIARHPNRPDTTVAITCRHRPDDVHRLWFFAKDMPITEADRIFDAAVAICGLVTEELGGEHR